MEKVDPKPSDVEFLAVFRTSINPELKQLVISDLSVEQIVAMCCVHAKFGDSRSNGGRIIRLFARLTRFYALLCST